MTEIKITVTEKSGFHCITVHDGRGGCAGFDMKPPYDFAKAWVMLQPILATSIKRAVNEVSA